MALLGTLDVRLDPVLNHNFVISLLDTSSSLVFAKTAALSALADVLLGGFSECSGLEMSLQVEDYRPGGTNGAVLKFPSGVSWSNITLRKGIGASEALWDWIYGFVEGRGKRRDGVIALINDLRLPIRVWYFRRALPLRYSGPALNATQSTVAIEAIEFCHEGLYQVPYVGVGGAVATLGAEALL